MVVPVVASMIYETPPEYATCRRQGQDLSAPSPDHALERALICECEMNMEFVYRWDLQHDLHSSGGRSDTIPDIGTCTSMVKPQQLIDFGALYYYYCAGSNARVVLYVTRR